MNVADPTFLFRFMSKTNSISFSIRIHLQIFYFLRNVIKYQIIRSVTLKRVTFVKYFLLEVDINGEKRIIIE